MKKVLFSLSAVFFVFAAVLSILNIFHIYIYPIVFDPGYLLWILSFLWIGCLTGALVMSLHARKNKLFVVTAALVLLLPMSVLQLGVRSRFACYSFENGSYTFVVQERQAGISASVSVYQKTSLCTARLLQASLIEKVGSSSADSYTLTFRDGDLKFLIPSISETPLSVPYIKK